MGLFKASKQLAEKKRDHTEKEKQKHYEQLHLD